MLATHEAVVLIKAGFDVRPVHVIPSDDLKPEQWVYEILAERHGESAPSINTQIADLSTQAFERFHHGDLAEMKELLKKVLAIRPNDSVCKHLSNDALRDSTSAEIPPDACRIAGPSLYGWNDPSDADEVLNDDDDASSILTHLHGSRRGSGLARPPGKQSLYSAVQVRKAAASLHNSMGGGALDGSNVEENALLSRFSQQQQQQEQQQHQRDKVERQQRADSKTAEAMRRATSPLRPDHGGAASKAAAAAASNNDPRMKSASVHPLPWPSPQ